MTTEIRVWIGLPFQQLAAKSYPGDVASADVVALRSRLQSGVNNHWGRLDEGREDDGE